MVDASHIHSTLACFIAGDNDADPLEHSWWYTPLDFDGPAPKDPDSDTRLNNVNKWLASYNAKSKPFVEKFLYLPNGGNNVPIYYGTASDPVVDWGSGIKMHTPKNCPKPGSTGTGTRNGHLQLYDPYWCMATGYDGKASSFMRLDSKGVVQGVFDGTAGNDGPRGRGPWQLEMQMKEFTAIGAFNHRVAMGWVDGDQQKRTSFSDGPGAFRTKEFCWPMTGNDGGGIYAVEGQVFRLKAGVDIDGQTWADPVAHAVAHTMQTYGAVICDGEGPFTGGPIIDGYGTKKSLEVVQKFPLNPTNWEFVKKGYDPRDGATR